MTEPHTPDPFVICAVCGYPLERAANRESPNQPFGGQEWGHIRADMGDHVVVPVDASEIRFNQRCDFCDIENATMIVLADSFNLPGTNSRSIGNWAACDICAEMAERKRWSQLVTRVKNGTGPHARKAPRKLLLAMYEPLADHMHGVITQEEWKERNGYTPKGD
jgi:hypothetical protein